MIDRLEVGTPSDVASARICQHRLARGEELMGAAGHDHQAHQQKTRHEEQAFYEIGPAHCCLHQAEYYIIIR